MGSKEHPGAEYEGTLRCEGHPPYTGQTPPAVLGLLDVLQPLRKRSRTSTGSSDRDSAFCPSKTLWEGDTVLSLFTEINESSVSIHLLR